MDSEVITQITIEKYCEMCFERGQDEPPNGNLALTGGSWEDELEGGRCGEGEDGYKEQHV